MSTIAVEPFWDDRANVWRVALYEGDAEPTYLPGAGRSGPRHRLWPMVAAAAQTMTGATSDSEGMKWDPETTSKADMEKIARAVRHASAAVSRARRRGCCGSTRRVPLSARATFR